MSNYANDNAENTDLLQYCENAIKNSNLHEAIKHRLQQLVKLHTPKKVVYDETNDMIVCPNCDGNVYHHQHTNNCGDCGQALDWRIIMIDYIFAVSTDNLYTIRETYCMDIQFLKTNHLKKYDNSFVLDYINELEKKINEINLELIRRGEVE